LLATLAAFSYSTHSLVAKVAVMTGPVLCFNLSRWKKRTANFSRFLATLQVVSLKMF